MSNSSEITRRDFIGHAVRTGAALGTLGILGATAKGAGRSIKIGLIGCGGRGRGAVGFNLRAAKQLGIDVRVVATADYFVERAQQAGDAWGVPKQFCFGGADGYRKLLETDVELVLQVTPPVFRPLHLEAIIEAGKHAFIEKPVAVDPPGCRRIIAAGEKAKRKGLVIVAGTEKRHQRKYVDTQQALGVEAQFGRLQGGRVSFCIGHMFRREAINPKTPADLIGSWQNWVELSGDHIVEQHVHNIDIANWFAGHPPVSALGFGAPARRPAGNMYDFFSIDYDYGDGTHVHSMSRQVNGCHKWVGEDLVYQQGRTNGSDGPAPKQSPWLKDLPEARSGHMQEQINTLYLVQKGKPLDQARAVAESTAAAVMGRISAYTGQLVTWKQIMEDPDLAPSLYNLQLSPTAEDFESGNVRIPKEGVAAVPGKP